MYFHSSREAPERTADPGAAAREPAPDRAALQAVPAAARAGLLLLIVVSAALGVVPGLPAQAACSRRSARTTRPSSRCAAGRDDRDRDRHRRARRRPDAALEPGRPARDARPARGRLPPPAAAVARVLHAHAHGRGAVADLERHRRRAERRHQHRDLDRLERDDGRRDDDRHAPAQLAARAVRVRADPDLRPAHAPRRQRAAPDREDDAGDAGRHLEPRPGVALGLRDPARQDDGPRRTSSPTASSPTRCGWPSSRCASGWPAAG